jgi:hypothetical protein
VLLLLQSCLNLRVLGTEARVVFSKPRLPEYLEKVHIRGLRVAGATLDLSIIRHGDDVVIDVPRRDGAVEVALVE